MGDDGNDQLRAAMAGDAAATEQLFVRCLPWLRRLIAARLVQTGRRDVDVDDVVQETIADALRGLHNFKPRSRRAFVAWLAVCAENKVRDRGRRRRSLKHGGGREVRFADLGEVVPEPPMPDSGETPSQCASAHELTDRLARALATLPVRHRQVIELRIYRELSYGEIADAMGLPTRNAATALFRRARINLVRALAKPV